MTASPLAPEAEPPPQGGGSGIGGQPAGSPARGKGGQGDPSQPSANRRPTAVGKRPVVASRGPTRQAGHQPKGVTALACCLFAPGFTRAATVTSPRDEGQGRGLAPLRGSETPGTGYGRAHSEDTRALGAGPSLAPCTLRVRLGGRHGGSATSCFCANPCTHSVQDLNRLICFRIFWTIGEPPPHRRGQATGASWVAKAFHPQQAQAGSGGRGGRHSG